MVNIFLIFLFNGACPIKFKQLLLLNNIYVQKTQSRHSFRNLIDLFVYFSVHSFKTKTSSLFGLVYYVKAIVFSVHEPL